MKCVFAGTPEVSVPALAALLDSDHEVVAVLTQPPARRGRGRSLAASPVADLAASRGIEVLTPPSLKDPEAAARLAAVDADIVVVVAYGQIVPASLLGAFAHGWINLHFSMLPRWRGAAPVQRAIEAGDPETGLSVFQIEAGLDTGPVYACEPHPIRPDQTAGELLDVLADRGARLLVDVVDAIEAGTAHAAPQPGEGVTYAAMLTKAEGRLDFARPGEELTRHCLAYTPDPGAWAELGGVRVKVAGMRCLATTDLAPGQISAGKHDVRVGTGTCDVALGEVAAPGKRLMAAADWARGARLTAESRFGVGQ